MKKVSTTYSSDNHDFQITVNEDLDFKHVSVHDHGEPCSGILKHWGKPEDLIKELELIIKELQEI